MKTSNILIAGLTLTGLFASTTLAGEKCERKVVYFNPPAGSYKQVSPNEASKLKNFTFSNENEVCITLERIPEKTKNEETK